MTLSTLIALTRAPAALTVPGDTLAGASAAGRTLGGRALALPAASVAIYWAGMALNDWSDRDLDAVERPERPIPSGRITPGAALGVAAGLTATGVGLAAIGGGRDALAVAVPLAGAVWAYDLLLKATPAGPVGMAACRALDVLLGAGASGARTAAPTAAALAAHTLGVTVLSRGEVHGGSAVSGYTAAATSGLAAVLSTIGPARSRWHRLAGLAAGAGFAALVTPRQLAAARTPTAAGVRAATVAGIHAMVPLQVAHAVRTGSPLAAAVVAAGLPLARRLGRKVSPT